MRLANLRRLFEIDLRSLALFRASVSVIILFDLFYRSFDLSAHYTDWGAVPRIAVIEHWWEPGSFSLHLISGEWTFQALLFLVQAIAALCLLVGYRSRLSSFLCWLLVSSLHTRTPLVLQGGDILLRCVLFFAMFLPLGARYSVDEALSTEKSKPPKTLLSFATAALLLQVAIIYFATALLKSGSQWFPEGTATQLALAIDQFTKPLGAWLRQFPTFLRWNTLVIWFFELLGPFLFFMPWAFVPFRLFAIAGFAGLQFGLYNCMELGIFPFISTASLIPFLPSEVWETKKGAKLASRFQVAKARAYSWVQERLARRPNRIPTSRLENSLAGIFIVFVLLWNFAPWGANLEWVGNFLRIDQTWDMFAPYPLTEDGWYVMPGRLEDGKEVDVFRNGRSPVSWDEPAHIASTYPDDRWRSLMMMLWKAQYESFRGYYAEYLCRQWNASHPGESPLESLQIYFMERDVLPDGSHAPAEKVLLWEQNCQAPIAEPQYD